MSIVKCKKDKSFSIAFRMFGEKLLKTTDLNHCLGLAVLESGTFVSTF